MRTETAGHTLQFVGVDREVHLGVDRGKYIDTLGLESGHHHWVAPVSLFHSLEELQLIAAVMEHDEVIAQLADSSQEGVPNGPLVPLPVGPIARPSHSGTVVPGQPN